MVSYAQLIEEQIYSDPHQLRVGAGQLNGFGGLHGGVILAAGLASMRTHVDQDRYPLSLSAQFHGAIRTDSTLKSRAIRVAKTASFTEASITQGNSSEQLDLVSMQAIWADSDPHSYVKTLPWPTDIKAREKCQKFEVPKEFVPISPLFEIRPAAADLPYSGSSTARLCAWTTYCDTHATGDLTREQVTILADSLAPAITATFSELITAPSVSIIIQLTSDTLRYKDTESTVLIDAHAHMLSDTWATETITLWNIRGELLAESIQLRQLKRP
ncbi:MAG: acyl-CoA thioesterase domain-containing protein [Mycobacteriaceae bacterium]